MKSKAKKLNFFAVYVKIITGIHNSFQKFINTSMNIIENYFKP